MVGRPLQATNMIRLPKKQECEQHTQGIHIGNRVYPLSAKPQKWSNTLKADQLFECLTILWG